MELREIYEKYHSYEPTIYLRLKARFLRAGYAYYSVLSGYNVVISSSTHEYNKLKSFLIYLGLFAPITLNKYYIRKVVEKTGSTRKLIIVPLVGAVHLVTSAGGGLGMFLGIQAWRVLRSIYFASYLATLAFVIDDPRDKIYQESKIMRNSL